jgi:hypothetical protein
MATSHKSKDKFWHYAIYKNIPNNLAALHGVRSNPTTRTNKLSFGAVHTGEVGVIDV